MRTECLRSLAADDPVVVVDGTLGGGGHASAWLQTLPPGSTLVGLDRDPTAIERSRSVVRSNTHRVELRVASYREIGSVVAELGLDRVDRMLLDLGLSSDQLLDRSRGFGFQAGGELDLRFDPSDGIPANEWLQQTGVDEVAASLRNYADQPRAEAVAAALKQSPVRTTEQLVERVASVTGPGGPGKNPATRVVQALRIVVNDELGHLQTALTETIPAVMPPGGVLAVLSFHSIEDRLVKRALTSAGQDRSEPVWTLRPKKPILPRPAEVRDNPRSRSAKLRVAIRSGAAAD